MRSDFVRPSPAEINEMWARRKRGDTTKSIAQILGRRPETVYNWLRARGGVAPEPRRRAENQLTLVEREEISRDLQRVVQSLDNLAQCVVHRLRRGFRHPLTIADTRYCNRTAP